MKQQHIDQETLSLFVNLTALPEYEISEHDKSGLNSMRGTLYHEVLDHLALCEECRNQVSILTSLKENRSDIIPHSELTEDQHQLICDYVDGSLTSDEAKTVKKLIESQPDAMRAALHYQLHNESMQQQLPGVDVAERTDSAAPQKQQTFLPGIYSLLNRYFSQFFTVRLPLAYSMTVTAALIIAVLLLAEYSMLRSEQTVIASYQDNPTIQFTETNKLPGVGFFSQSGNTSQPFEGIEIELIADGKIRISWPPVDGAALYKIRIQVFNRGKKTLLKENSTQDNHTTFLLEPGDQGTVNGLAQNKRYEWTLYGNTRDDRMFYASGGFVISRVDMKADTW